MLIPPLERGDQTQSHAGKRWQKTWFGNVLKKIHALLVQIFRIHAGTLPLRTWFCFGMEHGICWPSI